MQKPILIGIVILAVVIIGWALWPSDGAPPEPGTAPVEAPPAPPLTPPQAPEPTPMESPESQPEAAQPPPEPEVELPPLTDSDPFVRERLEPLDLPEPWMEQGDYVRRLAVLAENATRGTYPRRQLTFLEPRGKFEVIEEDDGEQIYIDPASYNRYDSYVDELESVDPAEVAGLIDTLRPLVESALQEIGVDAPAGEVFEGAVREVLAVPEIEGEVELVQPNVMYEYADPELESLSPLKKQILRMGPENVARLKAYVRRVAEEMDIDV